MSWPTDVSPVVALLRDQIAIAGAADGIAAEQVHHPTANPSGAQGTADALPLVLIESVRIGATPVADGLALPSGTAELVLYTPSATGTAGAEALAQRLLTGLLAQQVGLLWRAGCSVGDASGPSAAELAAEAGQPAATTFRSVPISLAFGPQG